MKWDASITEGDIKSASRKLEKMEHEQIVALERSRELINSR